MQPTDRDIVALSRHPLARIALGLLLLAGLAVAALGGLREADSRQSLPQLASGQTASNGAYRLTADCAWISGRMPGRDNPDPGLRYLVLRLRVLNQMDSARHGLEQDVVWVPQGTGDFRQPDLMLRADDHSLQVTPQPRLPTSIDVVWKLPAGSALAQPVTWGVFERTYVPKGYVSGEAGWLQGNPAFRIRMRAGTDCTGGEG